jgi:DNA-directed RNA polymerase subunit beta
MLNVTELSAGDSKKLVFSNKKKLQLKIPNLIEVQKEAYRTFLQAGQEPGDRMNTGLQEVFNDIFPIQDHVGKLAVEFIEYSLGLGRCKKCPEAKKGRACLYHSCYHQKYRSCKIVDIDNKPYRLKYDANQCRKRHITYGVPLQMKVQLINKETGEIKEQEIFMVNLPILTDQGTFVINGAERVIVSQLHRSPGVFYSYDKIKKIYGCKIVPYRGAWLEFEVDVIKDVMYVRIDRKRKQHVSVLLRALGYEDNERILELFNHNDYIKNTIAHDKTKTEEEALKEIYGRLRPGEPFTEANARVMAESLYFSTRKYDLADVGRYKMNQKLRLDDRILGKIAAETILDSKGSVIINAGEPVTESIAQTITAETRGRILKFKTSEDVEFEIFNDYPFEEVRLCIIQKNWEDKIIGWESAQNIVDDSTGEIVVEFREKITPESARILKSIGRTDVKVIKNGVERVYSGKDYDFWDEQVKAEYLDSDHIRKLLVGRVLAEDIKDEYSDVVIDKGTEIKSRHIRKIKNLGITRVKLFKGRVLSRNDIISVIRYLLDLCNNIGCIDDIDHLGNRRVRRSGELLQNALRASLSRMESDVRERMTIQDISGITPQALINTRPIASAVKDFFGTSQLSQFMDQTNPLSELTHKRKLSALGPGGLKRERAGYEVRDVHATHYGRICPIETPEGPNAGLIGSLAIYAKINDFGFIETPLTPFKDGKITDNYAYFDAYQEDAFTVASPDIALNEDGSIKEPMLPATFLSEGEHEFSMISSEQVDHIRVSPLQMVSVAAALIPFLEHDDANRALMGTNMQRQAVPLLITDSAYVMTGLEHRVAKDSGASIISKHDGAVLNVAADYIEIVRHDGFQDALEEISLKDEDFDEKVRGCYAAQDLIDKKASDPANALVISAGDRIDSDFVIGRIKMAASKKFKIKACHIDRYDLLKFCRSNHGTCFDQKVIVNKDQIVKSGDIIADGPSSYKGEIALGKNVLVAFMPWEGYNYEDAILLSERMVIDDVYTSIHIEEHEVEARDTKLGEEEITRDIPNVSPEALSKLDESGIIKIGSEVSPGDILVGKVTPKGVTELSAEEKLLRAIFGEKAREVRNTSYTLPHGENGKVVDIMEFTRENKDELPHGVNRLVRVFIAQKRKISEGDKMAGRHGNKGVISKILPVEDMPFMPDGTAIDIVLNPLGVPSRMNLGQILETHLGYALDTLGYKSITNIFNSANEEQINKLIVLSDLVRYNKAPMLDPLRGNTVSYLTFDDFDKSIINKSIVENRNFEDILSELIFKYNGRITCPETGVTVFYLKKGVSADSIAQALKNDDLFTVFEAYYPDEAEINQIKNWYAALPNIVIDPEVIKNRKSLKKQDFSDEQYENLTESITENKDSGVPEKQFDNSMPYGKLYYPMIKTDFSSYKFRKNINLAGHEERIKNIGDVIRHFSFWKHETGKRYIYDGRTGDKFENPVTIGKIYMLKLAHLVEDKIHARATGPYSLVTQQPLGGKAQFGGQRFGEMEVWALEAYGAAHVLQEFLTVKSDDVEGRVDVYETLIKNENKTKPRIPEAFNVLVSELRSLGLKIDLINKASEVKKEIEGRIDSSSSAEEVFSDLFNNVIEPKEEDSN